ncbi:MAG: transglutaminase domain-containing protein [Chitinophagaceae bacterium]
MKLSTTFALITAALGLSLSGAAQKIEELKSKYPGQEVVILNSSTQFRLSIKDGEPSVESKETEQVLYLSADAASYLSGYGFTTSHFHDVKEYEAYTQTAENKKIKVTGFKTSDSKSSSVFYDDVKDIRFNFPAIGPGAIGVLNMKVAHAKPYLLSPYYFARTIPVINNELSISFPKDMSVKYVFKGLGTDKILFTQDKKGGEIIYRFQVKDQPALQKYPDAPGEAYYAPHVIFYIEKYKNEKGDEITYLADTNALYKLNRSFVKDINKEASPELKRIVDSLTHNATSQEEKARNIYSWVQNHIKYVAFEDGMGGFIPRDANFVCERRYGDCKDMSSILTLMLNTAGVPAYYTWIGTRDLPYSYRETPLPMVSNHMICAIQLKKDEFTFLDGTDPTCVFGLPPSGIQDKEAMIGLSPDQYRIVTVPSIPAQVSVKTDSCFLQFTDQGINGFITQQMSGYFAMHTYGLLSYYNEKDKEEYMKGRFSRGSNKFHLINYETGNQNSKEKVALTARFDLQDYARKIGDEWYLNLNLLKLYVHEEIDYPRRTIPIESDFRCINRYVTVLTIPEGYKVTYLPQGKSFKNEIWGFTINYEQKGNSIVLTQEFSNNHLLLQPADFKAWNEVLEHLYPQYKESISLSKK